MDTNRRELPKCGREVEVHYDTMLQCGVFSLELVLISFAASSVHSRFN